MHSLYWSTMSLRANNPPAAPTAAAGTQKTNVTMQMATPIPPPIAATPTSLSGELVQPALHNNNDKRALRDTLAM
jgi:hypothetical protein